MNAIEGTKEGWKGRSVKETTGLERGAWVERVAFGIEEEGRIARGGKYSGRRLEDGIVGEVR